jgi:hypothetical protein
MTAHRTKHVTAKASNGSARVMAMPVRLLESLSDSEVFELCGELGGSTISVACTPVIGDAGIESTWCSRDALNADSVRTAAGGVGVTVSGLDDRAARVSTTGGCCMNFVHS